MAHWRGSDRKQRLPPNWPTLRRQAKERAGGICEMVAHGYRCTEVGTDADHIEPSGSDDLSNIQWLCRKHHLQKTGRDSHHLRRKKIKAAKARFEKRFGHQEVHSGSGQPFKHPWQK